MKKILVLVSCLWLANFNAARAQQKNKPEAVLEKKYNVVLIDSADTEADIIRKAANVVPTERQLRWQQLELTGFLHFGVNTFTGREWGSGKENPSIFNPADLDAKQWIKVCKAAGIKQVILTAKHHDGFCLWPSKYTNHSVKSSPWKNGKGDVVREVAEACKEFKIGFGIYLSPWDMNSPIYGSDAYNDYFVNQLTELLTNYGKVDEVWFDGANGEGPNGKKQVYDFSRWYALIRKLQPNAVIAIMGPDVRWVGTETGQDRETEWSVVPANNLNQKSIAENSQRSISFKPEGDMRDNDLGSREKIKTAKGLVWYPAETDVSIRPGWFYHQEQDSKVKTTQQLLDIYFNSVGRNGVLLLNIPPDKNGLITQYDADTLAKWNSIFSKTFSRNIINESKPAVAKNNLNVKLLCDKKLNTSVNFNRYSNEIVLEFSTVKTFNLLALQENIAKGQRVEQFVLEQFKNGVWEKICEGTTIGYKRLLRFNEVTTNKVRFRILSSRFDAHLSEIGLYYLANQ